MAFFGICYSPYHHNSDPPGTQIVTERNVSDDIGRIKAAGYNAIRTYSTDAGNQWNVTVAANQWKMAKDLYLAVGAWFYPEAPPQTKSQIEDALNQVGYARDNLYPDFSCDLVVGNEVDIQGNNPQGNPPKVKDMITHAIARRNVFAQKIPSLSNVRVTTCITANALAFHYSEWEDVVKTCEGIVYVTVYPYLDPKGPPPPNNIKPQMDWAFEQFARANKLGKEVVIAEIGWPTFDKIYPSSATPANQKTNYDETKKWVSNLDTFWFEMFDEPWKMNEKPDRGYGPYWGLYDKDGNKKW
jgi:exo-beta-1,3-glucanase (GH17 family)